MGSVAAARAVSAKCCGSGGGDLSKLQWNFATAILRRREAFHLQAWTGPRRSSRDDIAGAGMTEERARVISRLTRSRKPRL